MSVVLLHAEDGEEVGWMVVLGKRERKGEGERERDVRCKLNKSCLRDPL